MTSPQPLGPMATTIYVHRDGEPLDSRGAPAGSMRNRVPNQSPFRACCTDGSPNSTRVATHDADCHVEVPSTDNATCSA